MSRTAYSDRIMNRYFRRNLINGIYTLFGKKYIIYTLIVIISITMSIGSYILLQNSNLYLLQSILIFQISLIFSFILTGVIAFKLKSTTLRISLIVIFSIVLFFLFETNLNNIWKDMLNLQIILSMALITLSFLTIIRNLNTSWLGKLWVIGKAEETTVMRTMIRSVGIGLLISIFFGYLFLTPPPFENPNYYYLIAAITNAIANLFLNLIIFKKSFYLKYVAHSYFVQTITLFYYVSIIPLIFIGFILNQDFLPIFNIALLIFSILTLTQAITMESTKIEEEMKSQGFLQRLTQGSPKKEIFQEKDVVIIDIEEDKEIDKSKIKKMGKKKNTDKLSSKDGKIIILLGLVIPIQFFIINFYLNPEILIPIPVLIPPIIYLPFSLITLDVIISIIGLGIIVASIFLNFSSKKVRNWYLNTVPLKAAFYEFLTLIERKERMELLSEMAETIRETLIAGIMDFIDGARDDIESTIMQGRDFFRKFFGI